MVILLDIYCLIQRQNVKKQRARKKIILSDTSDLQTVCYVSSQQYLGVDFISGG